MKQRNAVYYLCLVAFGTAINIIGSEIALWMRLPIYLDSIGTLLIAGLCEPLYALLPSLLSGLIYGILSDIYALYYAPTGMLLGYLCALMWQKYNKHNRWYCAMIIALPPAFISGLITAFLFHGVTSSGSAYFVQLLAQTPLGITLSCILVQLFSEYIDRLFSLYLCERLIQRLPSSLRRHMIRSDESTQ